MDIHLRSISLGKYPITTSLRIVENRIYNIVHWNFSLGATSAPPGEMNLTLWIIYRR
jgi:hypothetical protein